MSAITLSLKTLTEIRKENKQIQIVVAQLLHKKIMPKQVYKAIFRHTKQ